MIAASLLLRSTLLTMGSSAGLCRNSKAALAGRDMADNTFVVDQDGVVFQKDLGRGTAATAAAMTRSDSDLTWVRVDVTSD